MNIKNIKKNFRDFWFFPLFHYAIIPLFLVVICVFLLSNFACNVQDQGEEDPSETGTYTLSVWLGTGVEGSPKTGEYSYSQGESVSYEYKLITGYFDLTVTLDGEKVSATSSINMDRNHTLNASSGSSSDYFVSKNGNDNNNGRSANSAFKTIGKAFQVVQPGETIFVFAGIYNEDLILENIGSSSAPITLRGQGNTTALGDKKSNIPNSNNSPILDGQRKKALGIWFENCKNLVFENLEIRSYTDIGIGFYECSKITLRSLKVHHNGFAVQLKDWELEGYGIHIDESSNVFIAENEVYQNGPNPQKDILMGTGINTFGCRDCTIRSNRCYENIGGGMLVEDGVNVLVEDNEVFNNDLDASIDEWWDGGLWVDGGHDITIRNNTFYGNLGPGIEISDEDFQEPYGYILINNTSQNNYYGIFIWNFGSNDWPPENIIKRSGNIFKNNSIKDIWIVPWY